MIVSHAAAAQVNQQQYAALARLGWEVHLIIPRRWRDGFDATALDTVLVSSLQAHGRRLRVVGAGRPQRHLYVARTSAIVRAVAPDVAFVEAEPFSAPAWQWALSLAAAGVPFGVQHAETLDRRLPLPARVFRRAVLARAAFVAARSPRAAELITEVPAHFIAHPLPDWEGLPRHEPADGFVAGFAGRLVEEKGILDLLRALSELQDVRLLVVGDGPLRRDVEAAVAASNGRIELRTDVRHAEMPSVYAQMDVLVLPSRSTPTWTEQFGRVLIEAMSMGVPVIGSDSGEIPWVIETTGGGVVVPEGDADALADVLRELAAAPDRGSTLGEVGRRSVAETFSMDAVVAQIDALFREIARPFGS